MGHIAPIFAALAILIADEEGLGSDLRQPWLALAPLLLAHALSLATRRAFVAGRFALGEWLFRALTWSPVLSFAFAVLGCGWAQWVDELLDEPANTLGWPQPSLLLGLAPFVAYTLLAFDAKARLGDPRTDEVARARRFETRLFLSTLAPIAFLVLASCVIGLHDEVRANVEFVALWSGLFATLLVAGTMALLPRMLRHVWQTTPMAAGPVRAALEGFAARIGFRCGQLSTWHTGFQMSNAAVVGIGPGRLVMFTDLLLAQLRERELVAVFAHEIGHVVRHHVVVFIAWSLALFLGAELVLSRAGFGGEWLTASIYLALAALWYVVLGWYSRRIEVEADLYSVGVTGDPEAMITALERVAGRHGRALHSWRHFSADKRVELLRACVADPDLGRRWSWQLRWIGRVGVVLGSVVLALQAWTLVESFESDRIVVELALGRYEDAARCAGGVGELDPNLASLVQRAMALPDDARRPSKLLELASEARATNDASREFELLTLAQLRGAPDADGSVAERIDELAATLRTGSR